MSRKLKQAAQKSKAPHPQRNVAAVRQLPDIAPEVLPSFFATAAISEYQDAYLASMAEMVATTHVLIRMMAEQAQELKKLRTEVIRMKPLEAGSDTPDAVQSSTGSRTYGESVWKLIKNKNHGGSGI